MNASDSTESKSKPAVKPISRLLAALLWSASAVIAGLLCYAAVVLVMLTLFEVSSYPGRIGSFIYVMMAAAFIGVVFGLPVALLVSMCWMFIARVIPRLDTTWRGVLTGSGIVAAVCSALYVATNVRDTSDVSLILMQFNSIIVIFASVLGGLVLPRRFVRWLPLGVFAARERVPD